MRRIDDFLNSITMYKTIFYGLILLIICAFIVSFMGNLTFPPLFLFFSLLTVVSICFVTNLVFAKLFKTPTNSESYIITAFILFFLFSPPTNGVYELIPISLAAFLAMASKYILSIKRRHIFNPAAISAVLVTFLGFSTSWWIATPVLFPATVIIGLLIIRKVRKFFLFFAFFSVVIVEMLIFGNFYRVSPQSVLAQLFLSWPFMFFASFMLTEPLTMPPTRYLQMLYGALIGFLFALQIPLGPISLSPELSLVIGNIFSYFLSPKQRLILTLKKIEKLSSTIYNFSFTPNEKLLFKAGQYMEWTLTHKKTDARGNRRYFTIASSPTEKDIMLGVRITGDGSSFKKTLLNLNKEDKILIGSLAGDFILPKNPKLKLVFLAGGIGITPFRSMLKYLIDKRERRDIVLFHLCSNEEDFVYNNIFQRAKKMFGLRTIRLLSEKEGAPQNFKGEFEPLNADLLKKYVPDYENRIYYISGANIMVDADKKILKDLGIKESQIVTDYFSGY